MTTGFTTPRPVAAALFDQRSARARRDDTAEAIETTDGQRLAAALQQVATLQRRDALLRQEITLLTRLVARVRRFAHHDELTGLPNRSLLLDRFDQAVARGARQHKQVALLFLDLDGFKRINDVLGHAAGDDLLRQVAARLQACIRASDTACRYGGDEFVILLPELEGNDSAASVCEKIRAHLTQPYLVHGNTIRITSSLGMAVYPADGKHCRDLLHASDLAMYRYKARSPAPPTFLGTGWCAPGRADGGAAPRPVRSGAAATDPPRAKAAT